MTRTILIVEDNHEFRTLLRKILLNAGYKAIEAVNGQEGLEAARKHRPDMVLCDVQMPLMNGYELVAALRAEPELGPVPIIMISVQSKVDEVVKGLKVGADDYLTKPFDPDEVIARVGSLFRQSGREERTR